MLNLYGMVGFARCCGKFIAMIDIIKDKTYQRIQMELLVHENKTGGKQNKAKIEWAGSQKNLTCLSLENFMLPKHKQKKN